MGGLDRDQPAWERNTSGLPRYYYERGDKIGFERPVSNVYCSTGALKVDYYKYPANMTADGDEPFDGAAYLQIYSDVIILGVSVKCKQDELKWTEAASLYSEYVAIINLMIDSLNQRTDNTVQHIKVGQ